MDLEQIIIDEIESEKLLLETIESSSFDDKSKEQIRLRTYDKYKQQQLIWELELS